MRISVVLTFILLSASAIAQNYYMFVGTYTKGNSEGIYVYRFNTNNGGVVLLSTIKTDNPSYLTISPNGKYLYAVNENDTVGGVSSFVFDRGTGQLHLLNRQSSEGADPCYVTEDRSGRWVAVANYSSGSAVALPVNPDGSLNPAAQVIQHTGRGADPVRQSQPHVHSTVLSPDQHFLCVSDLGTDKLSIYRFSADRKIPLSSIKDSVVSLDPATGPRHFVFHPSKPFAYLIGELSGTVDAFTYTSSTGALKRLQRISSHPPAFKGQIGSADIHITPNGKFLYASNRGDANSIAVFSIDVNGKLHAKGFQSTLGVHPRNFMIDPTGRFLLVANRDTDNVVIFSINQQTGLLKNTGRQIKIPSPVCLKMVK
ncbi:MAG: 3-carboxymuconate cyclase [Bacteroidetes bacterium]|nr:MAG: 3-carboxymuconate cyclase [Bacteroidota bacterium]